MVQSVGAQRGGNGDAINWAPNHSGVAEMLRRRQMIAGAPKCPCFRKTSGSKMGAPNLLLAPGAI